jgi:hypothetical protein
VSDEEFLAAFEECTLIRAQWTHEAHVRMVWLYLNRKPLHEAIEKARSGIRRLNASYSRQSSGSEHSTADGYHDTITVAFVRLIASRLQGDDTFHAFRERNPDLFDRTLTALLHHYSKELLHSDAAKERFVEPDLLQLPI